MPAGRTSLAYVRSSRAVPMLWRCASSSLSCVVPPHVPRVSLMPSSAVAGASVVPKNR